MGCKGAQLGGEGPNVTAQISQLGYIEFSSSHHTLAT